jgi:hypothetical protein
MRNDQQNNPDTAADGSLVNYYGTIKSLDIKTLRAMMPSKR